MNQRNRDNILSSRPGKGDKSIMDFASWSPSHTILVLVVIIGFIGQVAVLFYRTSRLEKRADKTDRRIDELRDDFRTEMNQSFSDMRSEMNHRLSDVQSEIRDVRKEIGDVRKEMADVRKEMADVRTEISKLNQNHIDHLTHHN